MFRIETEGAGAIELADPGISCPANDDILAELGPDRWSVFGVAPADVIGRWAHFPDNYVLANRLSPGPRFRDDERVLMVPAHYDHLRRFDDGKISNDLDGVIGVGESFTSSVTILRTTFPLPVGNAQREWGPPGVSLPSPAMPRAGESSTRRSSSN
jgi:hypothetical protein